MQPRRPITVVLGRFEDLVARGLRGFIEDDGTLNLAAVDVDPAQLDVVVSAVRPDVALIGFGSLRSAADLHRLTADHPQTHFVVLANHPTPAEANQLLAFGASACLSKETQGRDILSAIHLAGRGLQVVPRSASAAATPALPDPAGPELLTAREADVLAELQLGRSNAEIAQTLHVGVETVRTHRRNIYRKLGVRTRSELASLSKRRSA